MNTLKTSLTVISILFLCTCQASEKTDNEDQEKQKSNTLQHVKKNQNNVTKIADKKMRVKMITLQGTIRYFDLEGGFYGIVTENGQKIFPVNLTEKYRLNGAQVKVEGELIPNVMTIQQWGTPFKIHQISIVKMVDIDAGTLM